MMKSIIWSEVAKRVDLPNGLVVVLLDRLGQEHRYERAECARNIFLVDSKGGVVWQVETSFDVDGGPFTNILYRDGELKGYRWDGGMYRIDVSTGRGLPDQL